MVEASVVVADRRSLGRYADALAGLTTISEEALSVDGPSAWPALPTEPGSDALLLFTSGTTSRPKAVRITHGNIRANTTSIVSYLGLHRADRVLVVLPFSYCYGLSLLHTHLRVGAALVLCNSFAYPENVVNLMEREAVTVFAGVPSSFQLLLRASTFGSRQLPCLRLIQQAGGKLPPALVEELRTAKPDAQLFVMYGQTEATARLSYLPPSELSVRPGSIGRGIPGVTLHVLDEHGREVTPGEQGEIYARGENISPGYYGDPAGSAEKFTPLGLRTGDLATVDDDGFISIVDRRDDFIKSWGHRISSQEVEACALRMPSLVSAAAVGVPDRDAGEAVTLFVTTRSGSGLVSDDVLAFCRQHLATYMVPRSVVVLDALPLNDSGKVAKTRLRELATARSVP
jgi:acyl-CoA synthetase (AMP-forming)/AMP-acid ligase II